MKYISKILSVFLVLVMMSALVINVAFVTSASSTTATPAMNLVKGTGCFNVVWNRVSSASYYRLYFGANGNWRRYTVLRPSDLSTYPKNTKSVQFLINRNSLTGRSWWKHGKDQNTATSSITAPNAYICQIQAFNRKNETIAWSKVCYIFYANTSLKAYQYGGDSVKLSWNYVPNAKMYQIAYRNNSKSPYKYELIKAGTTYIVYNLPNFKSYYFQVIPIYGKNGVVLAYGTWSNAAFVPNGYSSKNIYKAGLFTAPSIGVYNLPISLGVEQYIIDNYQIGMYYRVTDCFNEYTIVLFGHNYKTFGKIKNLNKNDIITVQGGGNTLKYKVYYKSICRMIDDYSMCDINTNQKFAPFYDDYSKDIYLITCHDTMYNCRWLVRGKLISVN